MDFNASSGCASFLTESATHDILNSEKISSPTALPRIEKESYSENKNLQKERCILVQRHSVNQVASSFEGLPHLVLYRLWEDNSVEKHEELEAICQYDFEKSEQTSFCINPKHYRKKMRGDAAARRNGSLKKINALKTSECCGVGISSSNTCSTDEDISTQHEYTITNFEADCQIGPIFHCFKENFNINGMFNYNPCKRDLNVQAEAITKSISIGQLTGLRSTKKSQILKIQLGKG